MRIIKQLLQFISDSLYNPQKLHILPQHETDNINKLLYSLQQFDFNQLVIDESQNTINDNIGVTQHSKDIIISDDKIVNRVCNQNDITNHNIDDMHIEHLQLDSWDSISQNANISLQDIFEQNTSDKANTKQIIDSAIHNISQSHNAEENTFACTCNESAESVITNNQILLEGNQSMPDFIESKSFLENQDISYNDTPHMHSFKLPDNPTEYDQYVDNHYTFISDFFPVNNADVQNLLATVNQSIQNNVHTSAIDIYKYWLLYLKNYHQDYRLYDFRNFNIKGEFIRRIDQELNDDLLDKYLLDIQPVIQYDEAEAKRKREQQLQDEAKQLLNSGQYKSEIDPDLGKQRATN